tara:strand:- start:35235 stop:36134 length:900 start_codon:yes stop_codon:yes gene_type:complete
MAFTKFDEYLNAKGSIPKPEVTTKHKVEGSKKAYKNAPDAENNLTTDKEGGKVSGKGKKKGMKYEAKGKMSGDWGKENSDLKWEPKTEFKKDTDKFIKATEGMDMVEFASYVSEQHLISDDVKEIPAISTPHGAFIPAPHELFRTTRFMIAANQKFMESFVREVKRNDGMAALISELTNHPELYSELAKALAGDEEFSKKLVRSIRLAEMVGSPMHKNIPEDDLGDGDEGPLEDDDEGEEDHPPMDLDDEDDDHGDMDDMDDEEEGEDGPPMDLGDEEGEEHPDVPPALANLKKAMGMY